MHINPYMVKPLGEPLLQPVINTITNRTDNAGTSISFFATLTPESTTNYTYTWSATGLPTGISIRASDGRISGNIDINLETQIYNVVVSVSVTNGTQTKTDTESFNWTVNKVIQGPARSSVFRNALGGAEFEDTVAKSGDVSPATFNTGSLIRTSGNIPNDWVSSSANFNDNIAAYIKNFEIGVGCTSIGVRAFLTSCPLDLHFKGPTIGLPESVTTIQDNAFKSKRNLCQNLPDEELIIPSSVRSIGNYAFQACTFVKKLTIKEGVTSIGRSAFSSLQYVNCPLVRIPDSVTTLDFAAFSGFTRHQGDVYFGSGLRSGNGTYGKKPWQGTVGGLPIKNLYINCPYSAAEAVNGFANMMSSSSKIYISPTYYSQWINALNDSNFAIYFATPAERLQWTSFPDAMDGAWLRSDYD